MPEVRYKAWIMEYFLSVLGMVFIIEALPYIAFPGKVKEYMRVVQVMPDRNLQIIGLILAVSGLAIVYIARYLVG
jgi:uncharacterized protein